MNAAAEIKATAPTARSNCGSSRCSSDRDHIGPA